MNIESQQYSALGRELVVDVARSFGEVRLKVSGASMIPAVWPGDVITVRRRDFAELQPGQIVLYRQEEKLVAHRIACVRGDRLTTRGDSLCYDDPPIRESDIVGQVVCLLRNGRRVHLKQSFWQRVNSSLLRRSDFCIRMALRLGCRLRRPAGEEMSWAS
ncbi:MAG TPA: S26 family signal peptidase [Edaphobacter sp.]|nr:S26 family signal peptidase [Edaphobacter sp.]